MQAEDNVVELSRDREAPAPLVVFHGSFLTMRTFQRDVSQATLPIGSAE